LEPEESVEVETVTPKTTRAKARSHTFYVDKPADKGGTDRGPMASEYFLASLASCHITTAHKIAEKRRLALEAVRIQAGAWFEGDLMARIRLDIHVKGPLSEEDRDTVFRLTERICTISQATKTPIERVFHLWK
jgi:putative redox protein